MTFRITVEVLEHAAVILIIVFLLANMNIISRIAIQSENTKFSQTFATAIFGMFGVIANYGGIVVSDQQILSAYAFYRLDANHILIPLSPAIIVIAAILKGRFVAVGASLITAVHLLWIGGAVGTANGFALLATGLLTCLSEKAQHANRKWALPTAFSFAAGAGLLYSISVLLWTRPLSFAWSAIAVSGLPLTAATVITVVIAVMMIRNVMRRQERATAVKIGTAFAISEKTLGYLKEGLNKKTANAIAHLLYQTLQTNGVIITDTEKVLAHVAVDSRMNETDNLLEQDIVQMALKTPVLQVVPNQLGSPAIVIPFKQSLQTAGLIILYYETPEQICDTEMVVADGLGKLISYQLSLLETEKLRILLKDTEVRSLQAQINPHFLFNTLNTVVTLIRTNPNQARTVMVHLANFMRMNLKLMASPVVSLEQELCLLESYIEIVRIRFAEQLTIELALDGKLEHFRIPPGTIQPLVENSIQHGLKKTANGGKVVVRIQRISSGAEVTVEDNGSGISEERLQNLAHRQLPSRRGSGIGVFNVNQRLIALMGEGSQLDIRNRAEGGCQVTFFLPAMQPERSCY